MRHPIGGLGLGQNAQDAQQKILSRAPQGGGNAGSVAPIALKNGKFLTPHTQADADAFRKDHPELIK